jgi:hypothetical protein
MQSSSAADDNTHSKTPETHAWPYIAEVTRLALEGSEMA